MGDGWWFERIIPDIHTYIHLHICIREICASIHTVLHTINTDPVETIRTKMSIIWEYINRRSTTPGCATPISTTTTPASFQFGSEGEVVNRRHTYFCLSGSTSPVVM